MIDVRPYEDEASANAPSAPGTVLLLDDAAAVNELLARELTSRLGCRVSALASVEELLALGSEAVFDVALVDLSYANSPLTGLDALCHLHATRPDTKLAILTQGDEWVAQMLRDAWEAFPLATALSKSAPTATLIDAVALLLEGEPVPPDPVLQPLLPANRSPWRSLEGYGRVIQHAGHAKLWRALVACEEEPSYRDVAEATGLTVNTVRNYREQLLGPLALHGLTHPSMHEMQQFARRCRPLLRPHIEARLARAGIAPDPRAEDTRPTAGDLPTD
jgi:DNA-binding NarL/FixJ family response regulator